MAINVSFNYNSVPRIRFGVNSLARAMENISALLGERIMIITDPGLTNLGLQSVLIKVVRGSKCFIFDQIEADPSLATVLSAIAFANENSVTGVIGFGGGSPMDVAKVTALICGSKECLDQAWGVENAQGPRLPLCLVPTTSGTGSEVTPISIITIDGAEKRGIVSSILIPDLAVLDPKLTIDLPPQISASTGVDAMVHAIEAFSSRNPNNNQLSKAMAKDALVFLSRSIVQVVENGKNLDARSDMLLGSMMAGMAFANSPVAAVHALAYPLGGTFHIPHGVSNSLVLSEVLKFNSSDEKAAEDYAALAQIVCPISTNFSSNQAEAVRFSGHFKNLSKKLGLPTRLRDLDIPKNSLKKLAADSMQQTRLLVNNPREIKESDALRIYETIW